MSMADALIQELEMEAATTRRVLERVPADRMDWKPHEKSMSLGQLAMHLAQNAGMVCDLVGPDEIEMPDFPGPQLPASTDEILAALDASTAHAKAYLADVGDEKLMAEWTLTKGGETVMQAPRAGVLRSIALNHAYHHRGQMTVYLRMLDVPLPSVYGPSADENPFA